MFFVMLSVLMNTRVAPRWEQFGVTHSRNSACGIVSTDIASTGATERVTGIVRELQRGGNSLGVTCSGNGTHVTT